MDDLSGHPSLPLVLAGPILRRVTPTGVTVWLASNTELRLELRIFDANNALISQPFPLPSTSEQKSRPGQTSWQLGDQLWVTLLEVSPQATATAFPLDVLLAYGLFERDSGEALDLDDVCLVGEIHPTFYIPSQLDLIAYGSCRKAHGLSFNDDGKMQDKDSLALLADHLDDNARHLEKRPALLFLLGDQIYADDVLPELMGFVQTLALQLMGRSIHLPVSGGVCHIGDAKRTELKAECGLTSSSRYGHVLSFGEYAALYLVMLGNRVGFDYEDTQPSGELRGQRRFSPDLLTRFGRHSLQHFVSSQAQVRKTFANIPTYMNFDDHDITDDWNLSRSWYDRVRCSPDGTRVISNGLAAYWAFQAWGNHPTGFPEQFIKTITGHLHHPEDEDKAKAFDFHLWKFRRWGFVLPTTPPVFVMDSRTQRDFGKNNEPPQLMDRYALDWMRGEWLRIANKKQVPIFMTGTPVFGFSSIEWVQYFLYRIGALLGNFTGVFSASNLDVESWIANRRGFAFFLDTLLVHMQLRKATFLSGDVHYSFVNQATYTNHSQPEGLRDLACLQLTSSALRNTPQAWRYLETFLANWAVKTRRGHCSPETLPWWERQFVWRFFRYDTWKMKVRGIPGRAVRQERARKPWWKHLLVWRRLYVTGWKITLRDEVSWITSRPNVALVYLRDGEVVKQVLLSGDEREHTLAYEIPSET